MDMTNGMAGGSMLDLAGLLQNSMRRNDGDGIFGGDGFILLFLLILFGGWGRKWLEPWTNRSTYK